MALTCWRIRLMSLCCAWMLPSLATPSKRLHLNIPTHTTCQIKVSMHLKSKCARRTKIETVEQTSNTAWWMRWVRVWELAPFLCQSTRLAMWVMAVWVEITRPESTLPSRPRLTLWIANIWVNKPFLLLVWTNSNQVYLWRMHLSCNPLKVPVCISQCSQMQISLLTLQAPSLAKDLLSVWHCRQRIDWGELTTLCLPRSQGRFMRQGTRHPRVHMVIHLCIQPWPLLLQGHRCQRLWCCDSKH